MKRHGQALGWTAFLLLAGAFLLLKNLNVFGDLGEAIWGGLFAAAGLGFLVWFMVDSQRWWRVVSGFTLLSTGTLLLLQWRGINLGDWSAPLVLFGIALGFWAGMAVHRDNWWALIPAGLLTVLGTLMGLQRSFERANAEASWLGVFFVGIGLVFLLLYLLRMGQNDTGWAAIPAAALILLGAVMLVNALNTAPVVMQWWPILLIVGAVGLLVGLLTRRAPPVTGAPSPAKPAKPQLPKTPTAAEPATTAPAAAEPAWIAPAAAGSASIAPAAAEPATIAPAPAEPAATAPAPAQAEPPASPPPVLPEPEVAPAPAPRESTTDIYDIWKKLPPEEPKG